MSSILSKYKSNGTIPTPKAAALTSKPAEVAPILTE